MTGVCVCMCVHVCHAQDDSPCTEMFKEWLARKPDASWDELIKSLDNIKMNTAARDVLKMMGSSKLTIYVTVKPISTEIYSSHISLCCFYYGSVKMPAK